MATKYNPYTAVKNISELKGKYHTAKDMGEDPEKYHSEAMQWYNELDANGYSDIADELSNSDYNASLEILERYKPDTEFNVDNYYASLQGSDSEKPKYSGSSEVDNVFIDEILGIAKGESTPKTSDTVNSILESFKNTDSLLNGDLRYDSQGNVIGGLNVDHYNTGKNQLDFINNFDYTKQSYFDPIMDTYKLKGDDASRGELASGASSNSGNIDSFAAANANRQQLAFTNAGHEAARAAAQQNQENWQTLYNAMSGNLSDMGAINAQNLDTAHNFYATESAERQNALAIGAQLATDKATRALNQYLAELEDATKRHEIDSNTAKSMAQQALDKYYAELQDAQLKYEYDMQSAEADKQRQHEIELLLKEIEGNRNLQYDAAELPYILAEKFGVDLGGEDEIADIPIQDYAKLLVDAIILGEYPEIQNWEDFERALKDAGANEDEIYELSNTYQNSPRYFDIFKK